MDKPRKLIMNSRFLAPDQEHSGPAFECIRDLKQTTAGLEGFWKTTTALEGFWTKLQRIPRSLVAPPKGGPADILISFIKPIKIYRKLLEMVGVYPTYVLQAGAFLARAFVVFLKSRSLVNTNFTDSEIRMHDEKQICSPIPLF